MNGESGTISLVDDTIRYRSSSYGEWELALDDVRIIGEATNQNGPFLDDYFFCFATGPQAWYEASFYAEGRDEFLQALSTRLDCNLDLQLASSTDFASRVLWPLELAGQPMFAYSDVPPKTWIGKLIGPMRKRGCMPMQCVRGSRHEGEAACANGTR